MRCAFIQNATVAGLQATDGSLSEAAFGSRSDALLAYVGPLPAPPTQALFFALELASDDAARLIALQRLLGDILVGALGEGFARRGAHVTHLGERISFVDFGRGNGFVNTRVGLYLPNAGSHAAEPGLTLTARRLPAPIHVWVPAVLEQAAREFEDMAAATFAFRLAKSRMRD